MGIEKRRENRVRVNWPAKAGRKGQGVFAVRILNASIRGLYFESPHQFPEKSRIFLEIQAQRGSQNQTLLIEGEVMRVVPTTNADVFGHGVQILRIRDNDLFFLLDIVAELWQAEQEESYAQTARQSR